jgi:phosphopantothenoylcysteine decarboxylase
VKVAPTHPSLAFFDAGDLRDASAVEDPLRLRNQGTVYLDSDEWPTGRLFEVGEPVLHIELRKWAELLLIAPLDANTLAKLSLGLCDNLLTCVYRAWDSSRPVVLAPAMNTLMWEHPATVRHLRQLLEDHGPGELPPSPTPDAVCDAIEGWCDRLHVIKPQSKRLACGVVGMGGMAEVPRIVMAVGDMLSRSALRTARER